MSEEQEPFVHRDGSTSPPRASKADRGPVMNAVTAPGRVPCPVPTCTNDAPSGYVMCLGCWALLPRHERIAVDATFNACRRQNTKANQNRHRIARTNAVRTATELRS